MRDGIETTCIWCGSMAFVPTEDLVTCCERPVFDCPCNGKPIAEEALCNSCKEKEEEEQWLS